MAPDIVPAADGETVGAPTPELSQVFHRLNNQLGVILANAELLEARLTEETQRARAGQVVCGALDAISAIQELRRIVAAQHPSLR
ncbi:MAG: hypothetical protein ABI051_12010 [Vicinamibacterales bacterium]